MTVIKHLILILSTVLLIIACNPALMLNQTAPELRGAPESSGLVVYHVEIVPAGASFGSSRRAKMSSGILQQIEGDSSISLEGEGFYDILIFSNVPPGNYVLEQTTGKWWVRDHWDTKKYDISDSTRDQLMVEVVKSQISYGGKLLVELGKGFRPKHKFEVGQDDANEVVMLEKLIPEYGTSGWAEIMKQRLAEIQPDD